MRFVPAIVLAAAVALVACSDDPATSPATQYSAACDTDLASDPSNCGACGHACAAPNATSSCQAGRCVIACDGLHVDRDGDAVNGCEYACVKTGDTETCDGLDNDCDGAIDEDGVCGDPEHCGTADTRCFFAHGNALCRDGKCALGPCAAGFHPDPTNPAPNCDYACYPTHGGKEICDGKDNDCNGKIDDAPDTSSDPLNCGACGRSCVGLFANAAPTCAGGACVLGACISGYANVDGKPENGCEYSCQSSCNFPFASGVCSANGSCTFGTCLLNHYDLDGKPENGCEYACVISNGAVEICDGKDNDCDGRIDESFDLASDPANCGACGARCDVLFPNAVVACAPSAGVPTCRATGCKPGYVERDGNPANGCEYACVVSNGGIEICDGKDNDCDGIADNPPGNVFTPALPEQCAPVKGECRSQTVCANGTPTCAVTVAAQIEVCDGKDNDCDGQTDEGPMPQVGLACGSSQVGACKFGTTVCNQGQISCAGAVLASPELCDGKDNDCNGVVDDATIDSGGACGSAVGACKPGANQCLDGGLVCTGNVAPSAEICSGPLGTTSSAYDDNCDGRVNEGCTTPAPGIVRLDTLSSSQGQHQSFQLAAATSGDELLLAYADQRSGAGDIYVRVSTDAGTSWGANDVRVTGDANVEVEPYPFLRPGRAYVAYSRFTGTVRRIYLRAASTPYTSWSAGLKVDTSAEADATIDGFSPQGVVAKAGATATSDLVAVVWSEIAGTQAAPTRDVFLRYSKDGGASFATTPLRVNTGAGAGKGEVPVIATNGNGVVYVAWRDRRGTNLAQVYVRKIDLTAATPGFSAEQVLQPNVAGANADQLVIAAEGNNAYVGWVDARTARTTIRIAASTNAGASWSSTDGDTGIVNLDSTFADARAPALAAAGGRIVVVWEDTRSGAADIRLNASTDAGKTWRTSSTRVDTGDGLGATASSAPRVALGTGDNLFVTWQDARFPLSAVLANVSIDLGLNVYPDAGLYRMDIDSANGGAGASSALPVVLASTARNLASVAWLDYRNASGNEGQNGDVWTRALR